MGKETTETIIQARELLRDLTPLNRDCGELCGSICCAEPEDGGITGMALFPGEVDLYARKSDWYKIYYDSKGKNPVLVCYGECPRDERPLACRIFPLTPYFKDGKLSVRIDDRAAGMCPLYAHGKRGLQRAFVEKVTEVSELLNQSAEMRQFIDDTSRRIDAETSVIRLFTGK